ncbi:EAL domain-containing protein [Ruminococcaceae bacterium OttesenSCG-928-D13]|nr:EAL domain-containing protein [Ruminococcaceae bacterium OttesenSCG-928-D13]
MYYPKETRQDFLRGIPDAERLMDAFDENWAGTDSIGFLCFDIYALRKIKRAYGRKVGDTLLDAIIEWVLDFPGGVIYRLESYQFCILFRNIDTGTLQQHAFKMESRFGKPWKLCVEDRSYNLFAQASIAILEDYGCDFQNELMELLDQALEVSRRERQIILFTEEQDRMTREQVRLQMELKNCILSDMEGFFLEFQPLVDPVTSTWRGLEALCRWKGPAIGQVPPGIFIEEVEEMGLIHQVGNWVLNEAVKTCKALRLDEIDRFFVSVNVSALQMNRHNYVRSVTDILEKHVYPADKLLLEITESTQFSFSASTMEAIDTLRAKGVMFALDDFGSGYSGFSNLKNLPVDMLKTDREFTENIENDTYLQYFYYIMSETSHANNMQLIAEGIETQEQLQCVVKNGADLIQGYLFGRPVGGETISRLRDNFTIPLPAFNDKMSGMVDFKQWMNSQQAYKITPSLFSIQSKCIGHILDEKNVEVALDKIMETVGLHFKISRVYVFLRDEGTIFSEKYEWCAEGAETQKHLFQNMDGTIDGFYQAIQENEVLMVTKETQLPSNLKGRLDDAGKRGSVQSIVAMPMRQRGEILGFVGYDSSSERVWMPEELIILNNLCLLCLIVLAKNNDI